MKRFYKSRQIVRPPKLLSSKYFKIVYSTLTLAVVISAVVLVKPTSIVEAACSPPATSYGTDTLSVTAPTTGTYTLWTRMQAPVASSNEIMLQVDGGNCYNVGGSSSMALNTWDWVNYQNGATTTPITMSLTAGTHSLEFIGSEPGVEVDRVLLLTDGSCVPTGTGTNCTPPLPVTVPYYQVAGGSGFTDSSGHVWQGDNYFTQNNTYGSTGGATVGGDGTACTTAAANEGCTSHAITGTTTQQAYQTERWGDFQYDIPINNGSYTVVLKFAEINPPSVATTARTFDVSLEGTQVLTNFNIASQVGDYAADDQTFPVTVTNGDLNVTFTTLTNAAKLSAIEILPQTTPTISLTAPTANSTVSGTAVPVSVALGNVDNSPTVSYTVDGTPITLTPGSSDTSGSWNSTTVADGSHTIGATVKDEGVSVSTSEKVTVDNNVCSGSPTAPSSLTDTDSTSRPANKVDLSWTASTPAANCTIAGYYIYRNGATTPTATVTTGLSYSDTTVAAATTYTYQVAAFDSSGHISAKTPASAPLSVTTGTNCTQGAGAPTTPTGLTETGDNYTNITLSWTGSTDSNGCTLTGYHVYRNNVLVGNSNGTATNYEDTGLSSGTTYNYSVIAYDSGGNNSVSSSSSPMSTEKDNVAPTIPTNVTATDVSSNAVNVSWSASTDLPNPGGVGIGGYNVYRNDSATPLVTLPATDTTYTDTSVSPGTTYKYALQAFDKNNNPSALTADVSVTTPQPTCSGNPSTPTALTSTAQTMTTISLSWSASSPGTGCTLLGYQVYRNDVALPNLVTSTNLTDDGLTPNTSYVYSVSSVDTSGAPSTPSADLTVATTGDTTPPTTPTNFSATAVTSSQVQLTWTASTDNVGVTAYNIYRNGILLKRVGVVTSYVDSTVSPSTSYTYTIRAFDAASNPSDPATATVTTPAAPVNVTAPTTPTGLQSILVTSNTVALTWNVTPGTVSTYIVYRDGVEIGTTTSNQYGDSGLSDNTTYTYTVAASNSGGASAQSGGLKVTTLTSGTTTLLGDVNGDGQVNILDLAILLSNWGKANATYQQGNVDNTATIGIQDLATLLSNWTGN